MDISNFQNLSKNTLRRYLNESDLHNCNDLQSLILDNDGDLAKAFGFEPEECRRFAELSRSSFCITNGSELDMDFFLIDNQIGKFQEGTFIEITVKIRSNYKKGGFSVKFIPKFRNDHFLSYRAGTSFPVDLYFSDYNKPILSKIQPDETILDYVDKYYGVISEYSDIFSYVTEKETLDKFHSACDKQFGKDSVSSFLYLPIAYSEYTYVNKALSRIGKKLDIEEIVTLSANRYKDKGLVSTTYRFIEGMSDSELISFYEENKELIKEINAKNAVEEEIAEEYNKRLMDARAEIWKFIAKTADKYGLEQRDFRISDFFSPVKVAPEYFSKRYKK